MAARRSRAVDGNQKPSHNDVIKRLSGASIFASRSRFWEELWTYIHERGVYV